MSLLAGRGRLEVDEAGWHAARMAVVGAAEHAAQQRVPCLAGAFTMQVLVGLRGRLRSGLQPPLAGAEDLATRAAQDAAGIALRAAQRGARSAITSLTSWLRLGPGQLSALDSLAQVAAEGAARKAVHEAGAVSLMLLGDAEEARRAGGGGPSRLWARAGALVWIRWLAARREGPPRLAEGLLRRLLPRRDRDVLLSDLDEEFEAHILPSCGPREARAWYWRQALRSVGPIGRMRLAALLGRLWLWRPR